ncbi:zf-HC2 domain-containing protein [Candidatus Sumerlaeota bacterium]|nr:zf-HC2 domain-containing protein [Candidatus Sumerlaeota bacterium]
MDKKRFDELLNDYLDGRLDGETREAFERALAEDAALRAEIEAEREVVSMLRKTSAPRAPSSLRGSVMARVREEASAASDAVESRPAPPFPSRKGWAAWLWETISVRPARFALAACALAGAVLVVTVLPPFSARHETPTRTAVSDSKDMSRTVAPPAPLEQSSRLGRDMDMTLAAGEAAQPTAEKEIASLEETSRLALAPTGTPEPPLPDLVVGPDGSDMQLADAEMPSESRERVLQPDQPAPVRETLSFGAFEAKLETASGATAGPPSASESVQHDLSAEAPTREEREGLTLGDVVAAPIVSPEVKTKAEKEESREFDRPRQVPVERFPPAPADRLEPLDRSHESPGMGRERIAVANRPEALAESVVDVAEKTDKPAAQASSEPAILALDLYLQADRIVSIPAARPSQSPPGSIKAPGLVTGIALARQRIVSAPLTLPQLEEQLRLAGFDTRYDEKAETLVCSIRGRDTAWAIERLRQIGVTVRSPEEGSARRGAGHLVPPDEEARRLFQRDAQQKGIAFVSDASTPAEDRALVVRSPDTAPQTLLVRIRVHRLSADGASN